MQGIVVAASLSEDHPAYLHVMMDAPHEHRGEYSINAPKLEWIDEDGNACTPWAESENPTGRCVIFTDDDGVEHAGTVVSAESPDFGRAVLSVIVASESTRSTLIAWHRYQSETARPANKGRACKSK